MVFWKIFTLFADLICAVLLTTSILLQSGKSSGLSAIAGSADSFMSKGGTQTRDAKLAKYTKVLGIVFVVLSLIAVMLVNACYAKIS